MKNRFFSVRCALLGYPRHRGLDQDLRYRVNTEIIEKLLSPRSQFQMALFNKGWAEQVNSDLNRAGKNKKLQKKILMVEAQNYHKKHQEEFTYLLLLETLPAGEQSRTKQGLMVLDLKDGIDLNRDKDLIKLENND